MAQSYAAIVYFKRSTSRFYIYESLDGKVIKYVSRDLLTQNPPDVLVDSSRTPTVADADLFPAQA